MAGWVWGLGIPIGLIQLIIPVASIVWIIVVAIAAAFTGPTVAVDRSVVVNDELWLPRTATEKNDAQDKGRRWEVVALSSEKPVALPENLASGLGAPWLLPSDDGLVVIRDGHAGVVRNGSVTELPDGDSLYPKSQVFTRGGEAAVLTREDDELRLRTWTAGRWTERGAIGLRLPESTYPDEIVVVEGSGLQVFMREGDHVWFGETTGGERAESFRKVSESDGGIAAGTIDGTLFLVRVTDKEEGKRVEALRRVGDNFKPVSHAVVDGADDLRWVTVKGKSELVVETTMGGVQLVGFDGERLVPGEKIGGGMGKVLFWALLPQGGSILLAAAFAGVVALLARSRRDDEVSGQDASTVRMASLGRRFAARLVDTLIAILPIAVVMTWALLDGSSASLQAAGSDGAQMGYVGWALLVTCVFSAMEGHLGISPGKALMGIRVVGEDLRACGFGRGIARNLLFVVDGLLTYQVGVMMLALSKRQQRLGDMAAKTLVIRK